MEFISQGVPVVVSRTKIDTFYFEEGVVHFFRSGDSQAMAEAMLDVINDKDLHDSLVARGYEYVERHGWNQKKKEYLDLIDSLSTEFFVNVQPAFGPTSAIQRDSQRQASADPCTGEVGSLSVEVNDPSSVTSLKSR